MPNSNRPKTAASSTRALPRPTSAAHAPALRSRAARPVPPAPNHPATLPPARHRAPSLWHDCRRLLDPQRAHRTTHHPISASLRPVALVAGALSLFSFAHGTTLQSKFACSDGGDLKAFGQAYPEVRTSETEFSYGAELWKAEADQISFNLSVRRTEFHRDSQRWTGPVTPQVGVNAQGFWSAPLPDKFQNLGVEFVWQHRFSPEWTLMFQARPGWRTAGTTTLASDGFGATAAMLAVWRASERLQFAFGAAGDSLASGSQQLLPIAGLDWSFTEHWRLSLGLPRTGVFWQVSEALELGLAAEGGWNTYYVRQRGAATYPYGRPLTETKLEHVEGRAGFQANWNLTKAVQLNLAVGVVGFRRFEYPDRNLVLKSDGIHGGYGSLGVTVNF